MFLWAKLDFELGIPQKDFFETTLKKKKLSSGIFKLIYPFSLMTSIDMFLITSPSINRLHALKPKPREFWKWAKLNCIISSSFKPLWVEENSSEVRSRKWTALRQRASCLNNNPNDGTCFIGFPLSVLKMLCFSSSLWQECPI